MPTKAEMRKKMSAAEKRIKELEAENEAIRVESMKNITEKQNHIEKISLQKWRYMKELDQEHRNRVMDWQLGERERKKMHEEWTNEKEKLVKKVEMVEAEKACWMKDYEQLEKKNEELKKKMLTMVPEIWVTGTHKEFYALVGEYIAANKELKLQLQLAELTNKDFLRDRRVRKEELERVYDRKHSLEKQNVNLQNSYSCWIRDKRLLAEKEKELEDNRRENQTLRSKITKMELDAVQDKSHIVDKYRHHTIAELTKLFVKLKESMDECDDVKTTGKWSRELATTLIETQERFTIPLCKICGFEYSEKLVAKSLGM